MWLLTDRNLRRLTICCESPAGASARGCSAGAASGSIICLNYTFERLSGLALSDGVLVLAVGHLQVRPIALKILDFHVVTVDVSALGKEPDALQQLPAGIEFEQVLAQLLVGVLDLPKAVAVLLADVVYKQQAQAVSPRGFVRVSTAFHIVLQEQPLQLLRFAGWLDL